MPPICPTGSAPSTGTIRPNVVILAVSALVLTEIVPTLLLGPVAGVVIDCFDRRRLLVVVDSVRAVLVLLLALAHALWACAGRFVHPRNELRKIVGLMRPIHL